MPQTSGSRSPTLSPAVQHYGKARSSTIGATLDVLWMVRSLDAIPRFNAVFDLFARAGQYVRDVMGIISVSGILTHTDGEST